MEPERVGTHRKSVGHADPGVGQTSADVTTLPIAVPADSSWSGCTTPGKFTGNSGTTPKAGIAKESAAVAIVSHTRTRQRGESGRPDGNSWMIRKKASESPIDAWKNQAAQAPPGRP